MKAPRVAFVTSHPIQYQVPVFRALEASAEIDFEVLFCMLPDAAAQGDGFGVEFEWDLPLLEGYQYSVLENVSQSPSVTKFAGCDTPSLERVLSEKKIDAVVVNGWVVKSCVQALRACRRLRIPCIVRGEANHLRPRPWWKKVVQRQLVRRFTGFLPIGSANREFYRSYGIKEEVMFAAPYCIENDRFARAAEEAAGQRSALREKWQIGGDAVCFLFCGKFEEKKHPVELLMAFAETVQRCEDRHRLHLLMVGDGDLRSQCQRFAEERCLPVTFTGFLNQTEIVQAYVACDCLVLPSDHGETWGLVVNEAMACGKPAIVSDQVGCSADLIEEGTTGAVFPFGDWQALDAEMLAFADRGELEPVIADACRRKIAEFEPDRAAAGILAAVKYCVDSCVSPVGTSSAT